MIEKLSHFLSMIRFSHTIFALPFAFLAALLAWRLPTDDAGNHVEFRWWHILGILVCMVGARSAAMAFNRLADHKIDAENPRTAKRHIPAGLLSTGQVAGFTIASSVIFIAGTLIFWPNLLPFYLSLPMLGIVLAYSYTKRFTALAHFWLGLSLLLAPVAAWIAVRGEAVIVNPIDVLPAIVVGLAVFFWVAGFDIIYACQDYEFDVQAKLKSVPSTFGISRSLKIALLCHLFMILMLVALPFTGRATGYPVDLGWIYWIGIGCVSALLLYEHSLVKPTDLSRVNVAFFNVNAVVSIGLLAIVAIDLLV